MSAVSFTHVAFLLRWQAHGLHWTYMRWTEVGGPSNGRACCFCLAATARLLCQVYAAQTVRWTIQTAASVGQRLQGLAVGPSAQKSLW